MTEKEGMDPEAKNGCMLVGSIAFNLLIAIGAVIKLSGFWLCTFAFLTFLIGGTIGSIIGIQIGGIVAKVKDEDSVHLAITATVIGAIIGCISVNSLLGKLLFNLDFTRLIR